MFVYIQDVSAFQCFCKIKKRINYLVTKKVNIKLANSKNRTNKQTNTKLINNKFINKIYLKKKLI